MSGTKDVKEQWIEQLILTCSYEAENIEEEHEYFRGVANAAPLKELEVFLSMPPGKFDGSARAVMEQVYNERSQKLHENNAKEAGRHDWWRGLAQQISAQVLGTLVIGVILGFITGVWFCA